MKTGSQNIGNPAVISAATSLASNKTVQTAAKVGGTVLVGGLAIWGGRRFYKIQRSKNTLRKGTKAVQSAVKLRSAMKRWSGTFPHQSSILSSFIMGSNFSLPDGTDEQAIAKVAAEITNWEEVQKEYYAIFWTELLADLQSELDQKEFDAFFAILNRKETVKEELKKTSKGHFSVGETIYALNNKVNVYDDISLDEVWDKYDAGEEIGEIVTVAKDKSGNYLYRVREWTTNDYFIPMLKYLWVRGGDVSNDKDSSGLSGLYQILG